MADLPFRIEKALRDAVDSKKDFNQFASVVDVLVKKLTKLTLREREDFMKELENAIKRHNEK